jgi:hypothetical protein
LGNFSNPTVAQEFQAAQKAAFALGLDATRVEVRSAEDIAPAIEPLNGRTDALYVCHTIRRS